MDPSLLPGIPCFQRGRFGKSRRPCDQRRDPTLVIVFALFTDSGLRCYIQIFHAGRTTKKESQELEEFAKITKSDSEEGIAKLISVFDPNTLSTVLGHFLGCHASVLLGHEKEAAD
ncbi:hypothetical protein L596_022200 [Steinernema carpocapsae]|uniref:Uncharacterized protein n=1 Tax=Steinernema carpocapsae TaxID=34508 RepID=A0A4U5MLF0_STECR|nr:hypothetical protein L596_022200 [Steinernema carpocapsae]